MSGLRRLDDAALPRAAATVQRWRRAASALLHPRGRILGLLPSALDEEPALLGSIVAVVIAACLLAATGEAGSSGGSSGEPPEPVGPSQRVVVLGPPPGSSVAAYLAAAGRDLRRFAETSRGRSTYALVDLRGYQTPAQAAQTFAGVGVARVFVKVPSRLPTDVHTIPVTGLASLPAGMRAAATVSAATAKSYTALRHELPALTKPRHGRAARHRSQLRQRYRQARRTAALEARALARPARCRCVFAALVHADVVHLAALTRLSQVRLVDPASPGVPLVDLTLRPLEPEVTEVVPRTGLPGG